MSNPWTATNRSASSGAAANVSVAAPASAGASGQTTRLRAIQCSLAGSGAGDDQLQIRDGSSSGAILAQFDLSVGANGFAALALTGLDIRSTPGNALTIMFVNGVSGNYENVNAQGDYVPSGYPMFFD